MDSKRTRFYSIAQCGRRKSLAEQAIMDTPAACLDKLVDYQQLFADFATRFYPPAAWIAAVASVKNCLYAPLCIATTVIKCTPVAPVSSIV
jgi:hypothetical protein